MNLDSLTEPHIRAAARRVSEESSTLASLFELARAQVQLVWVFDANVAHLFFDPHGHADFASPVHVASAHRRKRSVTAEPSEAALASVLADFLFGERFVQNLPSTANSGAEHEELGLRVILEPHASELHDAFLAIRRKTQKDAEVATGAMLGGKLQTKVRAEVDRLRSAGIENGEYVKRVQRLIRSSLKFLLPNSPLSQLERARDLLSRRAFLYEADVPWLSELLSTDEALVRLDDLTHDWYLHLLQAGTSARDGDAIKSDLDSSEQHRHARNDALALAKIQYLNEIGEVSSTKRCFVLVSAHGLVHRVVKEHGRARFPVLRPSVFLGSKYLFPIGQREVDEGLAGVEGGQWMRLTHSLEMIHESAVRHWPDHARPRGASLDSESLVDRFKRDWKALQDFALPFLPATSTDQRVISLASDLLQGVSLRAFEKSLYSALGDLLVLSSEISLRGDVATDANNLGYGVPAARLAAFPQAERCMLAIVEGSASVTMDRRLDVGGMMTALREEQEAAGVDDFNYPMLLCLAVWFFSIGRVRSARALVGHARAVVEVSSDRLPLVTGREAAFLESYFRRVDAGDLVAHGKAVAALDFYDSAIRREREHLAANVERNRGQSQKYCPEDELTIHEWRGRVARSGLYLAQVSIELFRGTEQSNKLVARSVRPLVRPLRDHLIQIVAELESADCREIVSEQPSLGLNAVWHFGLADGLVTAANLMLLIAAGDPGPDRLAPYRPMAARLESICSGLPGFVRGQASRHLALVSLVWSTTDKHHTVIDEGTGFASPDQSPAARMRRFVRWVAMNTWAGPETKD